MDVESTTANSQSNFFNHLKGEVFHLTARFRYDSILQSGKILNNQNNQFVINPGSKESFGRSKGWVCLFDLRKSTPQLINSIVEHYNFEWFSETEGNKKVYDLACFILDSNYYCRIIPNSRAPRGEQNIRNAEVWIDECVPIFWIKKVLFVKVSMPIPPIEKFCS